MTIGIDVPPVDNEQEALALMFYHLKMAAAYFEASPTEIETPDTHSKYAIQAWLMQMEAMYDDGGGD